ncbi:MAG: poly(3-hydroxybutyrate) depolymerase [Hyphomicrobiaceae bacterium]|nr:poly(3-hydroxybutyrate) depolymerase [Hyphomicrobiaceae bacterium]
MATPATTQSLPKLAADPSQTSVSGISSGAYMAGQYQIAHSSTVVGAAIIAGGPFGCAEARYGGFMLDSVRLGMNASQSIYGCMLDTLQVYGIPDPAHLAAETRRLAASGRIDPVEGLVRHRVYLFSGGKDNLVKQRIVVLAAELYLRLGVPRDSIKTAHLDDAGHGFVTVRPGANACGLSKPPYVVSCGDYDQAQSLLGQFYDLTGGRSEQPEGELITFDQRAFTRDLPSSRLSDNGRVFVPKSCRQAGGGGKCRIHVAFHGCNQNQAAVGDAFVTGTGYLNWADRNRIVVLFPDVAADSLVNPLGCWDWWGYTGFEYLTRDAPQITAIRRMVQHLASVP